MKAAHAALAVVAACAAVTAATAAEHAVRVVGNRFEPPVVTIVAGDTVHWTNHEKRTSHSVLWRASGEESERFFPGERRSRRFDAPGRYPYTCGPHPEMTGEIVVEAAR